MPSQHDRIALPTMLRAPAYCEHIFTARQQSCRKVIFSLVSVCLSVQGRGQSPSDYTGNLLALPPPPPLNMGPHCTGTRPAPVPFAVQWSPGSDTWWPRLETCSNLITWRHSPVLTSSGYWNTHVGSASRRYAFYWKAFLFVPQVDRCKREPV